RRSRVSPSSGRTPPSRAGSGMCSWDTPRAVLQRLLAALVDAGLGVDADVAGRAVVIGGDFAAFLTADDVADHVREFHALLAGGAVDLDLDLAVLADGDVELGRCHVSSLPRGDRNSERWEGSESEESMCPDLHGVFGMKVGWGTAATRWDEQQLHKG